MLPLLRLRARRIQRSLRESLTLLQPRRHRDPVHGSVLLVLAPRGASDVSPHNGLDGEHLQLAHLHRTVLEGRPDRFGDSRWEVEGEEVRAQSRDFGA